MTRRSNASAATVAALFRLQRAGKTRREAAAALGLNYHYICEAARFHAIPFRHGKEIAQPKRTRQREPIQRVKPLLRELDWPARLDAVTLIRRGGQCPAQVFANLGRHDLAERARELGVAA